MEIMASAEYVAIRGVRCPHCRSEDIEGGDITVEAGAAWQSVGCNECHQQWTDTYQLTGFKHLT